MFLWSLKVGNCEPVLRLCEDPVDIFIHPCRPILEVGMREQVVERLARLSFRAMMGVSSGDSGLLNKGMEGRTRS